MLADRQARDRTVLSTKITLGRREGGPTAGGKGRKAMLRSLDASLRRLGTEHLDLYILHACNALTLEEVLRGLDDLVSSGKVR